MITRSQIDQLVKFQNGEYLVTSCYLNLDRSKMPPQMLKIRVKDLLQAAQHDLQGKAGTHSQRESLRTDLQQIEEHVLERIPANTHRGMALFACSGEKFWQTYRLPRMVRNILIADRTPYIRPLTAILAEHHRYCTVLVDRIQGRIFEVYMGEIMEHTQIIDKVPRRVREGGYQGREERQIQRHHEQAVHHHYQHLADAVFDLFKRDKFDGIVLGGQRDVLREFKHHLHPYLRNCWAGDFHVEPAATALPEALRRTLEIEEQVEWQEEQRMAEELIRKVEAGQLAVSGVTATLNALARGEAQTLLVEDGFEMPGYVCRACHHISLEPVPCPHCQGMPEPCPDVVDEACEVAMLKNCRIEHLHGPTPLHDRAHIGALLRYQTAS